MLVLHAFAGLGMVSPAPRPALKPPALPVKLAGGLFLFATSVPKQVKDAAEELKRKSEVALRADPRVTMELGMGIEAGGIFASACTPDYKGLVVNFQINGGNIWAEATAYGVQSSNGEMELIDLAAANMDAVNDCCKLH